MTDIESFSFDLTDSVALNAVFRGLDFDLVVHCAGMIDVEGCERFPEKANEQNVTVTASLCNCVNQSAHFVFVSTDQVYGDAKALSETNEILVPINEYGRTKLLAEQIVKSTRSSYSIVRTNVFGSNIKPSRVSSAEWMLAEIRAHRTLGLFDDYFFSPIYSRQLARNLAKLHRTGGATVLNVGSVDACSKYEFGVALAERFGLDHSLLRRVPVSSFDFKAKRPGSLRLDTGKAQSLGLALFSYKESIDRWHHELEKGFE